MNSLLLQKQPKAESPRFRDFVCSLGCAYEPFTEAGDFCGGEIEPHHFPGIKQGGDDTRIVGLCHRHHAMFHASDRAVIAFVFKHSDTLNRLYLAAWLNAIEKANGAAPEPKRKQRAKKEPGTRPLSKKTNIYNPNDGTFREHGGE